MKIDILKRMKQPPGEDFFLISFVTDDSDPCWDLRNTVTGSWASLQRSINLFHFPKNFNVLFLQGDKAKDYLVQGAKEEFRYQQQQRSQPRN